ncbi:murein biosynthesis integral membrane protein MurJ [Labedella endophytica]|uniref:Murein biosynthesis integral membrane protein MurJ n=2 Tax=Labedella endophytica TaxID=1523160 RepID=A0A433JPH2_9MICO|nr:murein biosynthesis integral membrane protein MurJ [Labedella endophytica]
MVSRILGFVMAILLAQTVGAIGFSGDAFALANRLPNNLYALVAGGVVSAILVPSIVRAIVGEDRGRAYVNKLLTLGMVILLAATIIAVAAAPVLVRLYGQTMPQDQFDLAVTFAYWCLPQVFFYGLYALLGEVLNAHKLFGPFTWAPVFNNIVAISGLLAFGALFGADPTGERSVTSWSAPMVAVLAGSATLGIAVQAVVLFFFWKKVGLRFRPDFGWRGIGLAQTGKMAGWTLAMIGATLVAGIVQTNVTMLASGGEAATAALQYAWLIFMLPHSVIAVSVATAYFTRMAEHAHANRTAELKADVSSATRQISLLIVLAAAVIGACAMPFASLFTGTSSDAGALAGPLVAYVAGLVPFTILFVLQRTFYALGDTRTPFFFTVAQVIVFSGLALACGFLLPDDLIGIGVAASISLAGTVQMLLAFVLLRRKLGGLDVAPVIRAIVVYVVAAIPSLAAGLGTAWLLGAWVDGGFATTTVFGALVSMIVIGSVMAAVYFALLIVMRSPDLRAALAPIIRRFRRR